MSPRKQTARPEPTAEVERQTPKSPEWSATIETVLDRVSNGETLKAVAKDLGIAAETIRKALFEDEALNGRYARAREFQAESWADEIVSEANRQAEYGDKGVDSGEIALRRLRLDTKKWLMAKLHPRQYGEKIDVTSKGEQISGVVMLPPSDV